MTGVWDGGAILDEVTVVDAAAAPSGSAATELGSSRCSAPTPSDPATRTIVPTSAALLTIDSLRARLEELSVV